MFYIYFIIIVLLILLVIWSSLWLYKIYKIKHAAQNLLGKLIRLFDKRHELIETLINEKFLSSTNSLMILSKIISLVNTSNQTRDIYGKLKVEHEISESIKGIESSEDIIKINQEIHVTLGEYNLLVKKLINISQKPAVNLLFKVFKISILHEIEV